VSWVPADRLVAAHLVEALERWRTECRRLRQPFPEELVHLIEDCRRLHSRTSFQDASGPVTAGLPAVDREPSLLMSFDEVGHHIGRSRSHVERLVAGGRLPAVTVGRRGRRVRRADLVKLIEEGAL